MKHRIQSLLPVISFLLVGVTAYAAECLSYSGVLVLKGVLSRHSCAEQPNYESIEKGDAEATYLFVTPDVPFCVAGGEGVVGLEPPEKSVKRVQLVFSTEPLRAYKLLRPYIGKEIICSGTLFHQISGHHHSPVLLDNAQCHVWNAVYF